MDAALEQVIALAVGLMDAELVRESVQNSRKYLVTYRVHLVNVFLFVFCVM